jgi:RNA polymerase sigma-70 factor (ECF subfamily)
MFEPMTQSHSDELSSRAAKRPSEIAPTLGDLPDLLLVERARTRDFRGFDALMRRYNRRLFRIARSILPDVNEAEDAVHEAHLRAFTNLDRYEPTGKFGAWLARLAFNEAMMIRRRLGSAAAQSQNDGSGASSQAALSGMAPAQSAAGVAGKQVLEQAIDSLPEVFRTVFVLRAVEQLSGVETAACLGLNETTVRTRLFRAQQRLRADVAQQVRAERESVFEFEDARCERIVSRVLDKLGNHVRPQEPT